MLLLLLSARQDCLTETESKAELVASGRSYDKAPNHASADWTLHCQHIFFCISLMSSKILTRHFLSSNKIINKLEQKHRRSCDSLTTLTGFGIGLGGLSADSACSLLSATSLDITSQLHLTPFHPSPSPSSINLSCSPSHIYYLDLSDSILVYTSLSFF